MPGGVDAEGQRNSEGEQHGEKRHRGGHRQAAQDQIEHRHLVMDGLMAAAQQEVSNPIRVLAHERLVQTQFGAQIRQRLGGGVDPEYNLGRVAGQDE